MAIAAAVHALARMNTAEIRQKLEDFMEQSDGRVPHSKLEHKEQPLNSFTPDCWFRCFVDLFYRGYCMERSRQRSSPVLDGRQWAKCLLTRADFRGWSGSIDFVACLYNVLMRRDQLRAVSAEFKYNPFFQAEAEVLKEVTSEDLVAAALASGDCNSVRKLMQKKNLDGKVKVALQRMEIVQRRVEGSEADRSSCRFKFVAMRIWNGFSSLFFTLNPTISTTR